MANFIERNQQRKEIFSGWQGRPGSVASLPSRKPQKALCSCNWSFSRLSCRILKSLQAQCRKLWSSKQCVPMIILHHDIFFFLILILVFVSRMLVRALWHFNEQTNPIPQRIVHGTTIEIIRTIFPSVILLFIAIPSFALLYSMDGVLVDPAITIKAIGHQWYRSAPLNEGDLSATKCTGGSRSIWLTGHLPFPSSRD